MSLFSYALLLSVAGLAAAQCDSGVLVGVPTPGAVVYIAPGDPCTFVETVSEIGDCTSYIDVATLIGPAGSYIGTGTITSDGPSATIPYAGATSLPPGTYTLSDIITFGSGFLTQSWEEVITITNQPIVVDAASTSTILTSTTTYATTTDTITNTYTTSVTGPCTETVTAHDIITKTACPVLVTVTTTITPCAETKTAWSTDVVHATATCLPCQFPAPFTPCQRNLHTVDKRGRVLPRGVVPLEERQPVQEVEPVKRDLVARQGGDYCSLQGQPTATLYTTTIMITDTLTFTVCTDTKKVTTCTTVTDTLEGTTTVGETCTDTVTPTDTITCTEYAARPVTTTTDVITVTCNTKGPTITHCGAAPPASGGSPPPPSKGNSPPPPPPPPKEAPCTTTAKPASTPCDKPTFVTVEPCSKGGYTTKTCYQEPVTTVVPCEGGYTTSTYYPEVTQAAVAAGPAGTTPQPPAGAAVWTSAANRMEIAVAFFLGFIGLIGFILSA